MRKIFLTTLFLFLLSSPVWARTATWDGGGGDNLASTAANWDTDTAPVANDAIVFDGTSSKNCSFDIGGGATTYASMNTTGYGGVVTPSVNFALSGNLTLANGTFTHNSKTITFNSSSTITPGNNNLGNVTFSGAVTLASSLTVAGNLDVQNYNINGVYTIYLQGDLTANNFSTCQPTIEFSGSNTQAYAGGGANWNCSMTINKSGGTLTWSGTFITGFANTPTITYTAGTFTHTGTISTRGAGATFNMSGTTINNFTLGEYETPTVTLASNLNVAGNWTRTAGSLSGNYTVAFSGTNTINGNTTFYGLSCAGTCSFDDADTFTVTTCGGSGTYASDDATNQVDVNCTNNTITNANCTRVANSGANISSSGIITNCTGWSAGGVRGRMILMS